MDGSFNHVVPGQEDLGAADELFPRLTDPVFRDAEAGTSYAQTTNTFVIDSQPRIISNLISDQTAGNPAAVATAAANEFSSIVPVTPATPGAPTERHDRTSRWNLCQATNGTIVALWLAALKQAPF